jgi:predicted Zn-dependent protease
MNRRRWLQRGCAGCALLAGGFQAAAGDWEPPPRFVRPDLSTDEGGLWAMMDREETRLRRSPFRLRDEALQNYLGEIMQRLAGDHAPDMRTYAIRTPLFNASMAPNGMMQVWTGLMLRMDNEAQLAAVLGHEIGHYLQRHTLERLRDIKSRSAFGSFMLMFGLVGAMGAVASVAGAFGFSRDQERDADRIGILLMRRAGYDPTQASLVWGNLLDELHAGGQNDPAKNSPLFATHPPSDERRATLQTLALAQEGGGETREAEYRAHLAPLRREMLKDELRRTRYDESIALFGRLLARAADDADVLQCRGEALRQRNKDGDADAALVDLAAAVKTGREPAATYCTLGLLHRTLGQREAAAANFARYLERAPDAPDAALVRQYLEELKSS